MSDAFLERGEIVRPAAAMPRRRAPRGACRRPHQGQAGDRADQWRLGLGVGNVPGALKDHKRATLSTRSFGKGSVRPSSRSARQRRVRLTTRALLHTVGQVDQAKGIVPDIEVLQDAGRAEGAHRHQGRGSLRGHLKNDGDEKTGSQSYVPPDAKDDKA